jgi:hypothetical protein
MQIIKTYQKNEIELKNSLLRVGDLINSEGPLLSLFIDFRNNDLYVFDWIEANESFNKWLVYKVAAKELDLFLHKKISYGFLFNASLKESNCYIANIVNSKESEYILEPIDNIDEALIPTEGFYFEKEHSKNYDNIILTVNQILYKDRNEDLFPSNKMGYIEYYQEMKRDKFIVYNQHIIGAKPEAVIEVFNKLVDNLPDKIETQKNVRENNRLPQKEGMEFYSW